MDSDAKTCGKCKHGNFYDACPICEDAATEDGKHARLHRPGRIMTTAEIAPVALPAPDLTIGHSDEALREYGHACVEAERSASRSALRLALGAILQCSPCAAPDCMVAQREWLDDAAAAIKRALGDEATT